MKVGAPEKYKPEYVDIVRRLCSVGLIDTQIAAFFEVDVSTVNRWKNKHPDFHESMLKAKDEFDTTNVEKSLLSIALGYEHPTYKVISGKGLMGEIVHEVITKDEEGKPLMKHYPPNFNACKFWLKNRKSKRWKDNVDLIIDSVDEFEELTEDELDAEIKRLESIHNTEYEILE